MVLLLWFALPLILYFTTLVIKVVIATLEIQLKLLQKKERQGSLFSRLEAWAEEDDSVSGDLAKAKQGISKSTNGAVRGVKATGGVVRGTVKATGKTIKHTKRTIKFAVKTAKRSVKLVKFTVKYTIKAIKLTIRLLKQLIILIKSLITLLLSMGVVGIVILALALVVMIGAVAVTVIANNTISDSTADNSGNATITQQGGSYSGGSIVEIATREGMAQGNERIKYVLGGNSAYTADCARFVASVLTEAGYNAFGITASNHVGYKAHEDRTAIVSEACSNGGGVDCSSERAWVKANQPQAIIYDGSAGGFDISTLQPGDICYRGGSHVVIYMGKNSNGEDYICHASSSNPSSFSCSDDPNDLNKQPKYGFGFGRFEGYHHQNTDFVFRPSLLK